MSFVDDAMKQRINSKNSWVLSKLKCEIIYAIFRRKKQDNNLWELSPSIGK